MTKTVHKSISHKCISKIESIYIHIPFCKQKCNYCDFVSYAGKEGLIEGYVEALIQEINSPPFSPSLIKRGGYRAQRGGGELETIYFGGGTPTLLEPKYFNKIINTLIDHCKLKIENCEISIESNPGTADIDKLKALRSLGINRLSIGVQSFNDKHLKTLGRIHTAKQAIQFFKDARAAGFDNINLDLMFALPNQTLEEWKDDLATALSLEPEHLSIYNLQIEEGTPLWGMTNVKCQMSNGGKINLNLPDEDLDADMYEFAIDTLINAGYHHYEISNFAKPEFECQHNISYWKNKNYLGIGAGAHSHVDGKRWANPNCIEQYIGCGCATGNVEGQKSFGPSTQPIDDSSRSTDRHETIFMGLRLLDGISIETFKGFEKELDESIADGLLAIHNNNVKLTKRGLMLANQVFEKFV